MKTNIIKGFKVFNPDWTCRDYDFKIGVNADGSTVAVGTEHTFSGDVELCLSGFHFCEKLTDCFSYYSFDPANKVAIVEGEGCSELKDDCSKRAAKVLRVVSEISWVELLVLANEGNSNTGYSNTGNSNTGNSNTGNSNTGNRNTGNSNTGNSNTGNSNTGNSNTGNSNTGYRNTGNSNTGNWNTGDSNTGNSNTGNSNTGNWNATDKETGYFNSFRAKEVRVFNKPCDSALWEAADKPDFLFFALTYWCAEENKTKSYAYKEAFLVSWLAADKTDRVKVKELPNFDEEVFFEISGIRVSDYD
jgi:hypothetical protein